MVGKGVAEGGRSGTVRNPEKYCSRPNCNNYHVKGTTVCKVHGGQLPTVKRAAVSRTATKDMGVEPKDFPKAVGELVGWHLSLVLDLQEELDGLRLLGGPIEMAREYSDILDRLDKSSAGVAKLLGSVAALGIADAFQQQASAMSAGERDSRINRLFALTLEATPSGPVWSCPTCGRGCCSKVPDVVEAQVIEDA